LRLELNTLGVKSFVEFQQNPGNVLMIRERVNIEGIARPMESQEEMSVLRLKPAEIGIIKEAPTIRWLKGQEEWDKKYKQHAERAVRQRQKNEEKAKRLIAHAREQGLLLVSDAGPDLTSVLSTSAHATDGTIQHDRRWGPLDLDNESPPPTAIAKRQDTARRLTSFSVLLNDNNFLSRSRTLSLC
jgi:hypothetical protein